MIRFLLAALLLALPATAQERVLRFVPTGDLRVLDPIWTSAAITLNHGQMIYDVLVTMDSQFRPQLQMAESVHTSEDGLRWTFTLRPGLIFHDGTPVRAADVAASITRWAKRVTAGQALAGRARSIAAQDDRTVEIVFDKPFGPVMESLGSPLLAAFVMREADAQTDAFQQVRTAIGSGPYRFVPEEFRAGDRVVYRRFEGYVPRSEPPDGYAGGKVAHFDRVEWIYLPDPATAVGALAKGEVDFLEGVPADLLPVMRRAQGVTVEVLNRSGFIGTVRPNAVIPPFNDPRARQALLLAIDQDEFDNAIAAEPALAKRCQAVFVCGTPYESDVRLDEWRSPDLERAKRLLAESGYRGEKIVVLDPADQPDIRMMALLTANALRRIGANVEVQTMDWSTLITRRNTREPPDRNPNGWHIATTFWGGFSLSSPITNTPLVSTCDGRNLYGWPCDEEMERRRAAFLDARTLDAQKQAAAAIQERFFDVVPYVPTGIILRPVAYRADLKDLPATLYPVFWGIHR